jgi:hypothetical protein
MIIFPASQFVLVLRFSCRNPFASSFAQSLCGDNFSREKMRALKQKTHPAGEWAKTFFLISLTETPPATRMDAT